jgi:hypothetical protein
MDHLINPIHTFYTLKDNFIAYLEDDFCTRNEDFNIKFRDKLKEEGMFYREPWVEPMPGYKSSGKKVSDLTCGDVPFFKDDESLKKFKRLIDNNLIGDFPIYEHQWQMLQSAHEKHCVITSGTGSGKTESFLLPLFAYLTQEALSWSKPNEQTEEQIRSRNTWWNGLPDITIDKKLNNEDPDIVFNPDFYQRGHETRPPAIRSLIIYPMNALVEDQLTRMRKALDSDSARQTMNEIFNGNKIYFGRYNSDTPVSNYLWKLNKDTKNREKDDKRIEKLTKLLGDAGKNYEQVLEYLNTHPYDNEVRYFFPRIFQQAKDGYDLTSSEMRTRYDMHAYPPDILITNFSMLAVMLMRELEAPMFEQTKKWFEENKSAKFHLIIDELHLYRGAPGTEIAYLLRQFLHRIGLSPDSPQLRILASSASLEPNSPKSREFLHDFFGYARPVNDGDFKFKIIKGEPNLTPMEQPADLTGYEMKLINLAEEKNIDELKEKWEGLIPFLGTPEVFAGIMKAFTDENGTLRPHVLFPSEGIEDRWVVAKKLFPNILNSEDLRKPMEGLMVFRGLFDAYKPHVTLPRFRFHNFFRGITGIWTTIGTETGNQNTSYGKIDTIDFDPKQITVNGKRLFEVLFCQECGTTVVGGYKRGDEIFPDESNLEGIPENPIEPRLEGKTNAEYAVIWFPYKQTAENKSAWVYQEDNLVFASRYMDNILNNDVNNAVIANNNVAQWTNATLNIYTGRLNLVNLNPVDNNICAYIYQPNNATNANDLPALPALCPHCGADYSHRKKVSPFRSFSSGMSRDNQMLVKETMYLLPEKSRKIVAFTDSREDAARLSNNIERTQYSEVLRDLILKHALEYQAFPAEELERAFANNGNEVNGMINAVKNNQFDVFPDYGHRYPNIFSFINSNRQMNYDQIRMALYFSNKLKYLLGTAEQDADRKLQKQVLEKGYNPAGANVDVQEVKRNTTNANEYQPWIHAVNLDTLTLKSDYKTRDNNNYVEAVQKNLRINAEKTLFVRSNYNLEELGLGYVGFAKDHNVVDVLMENLRNATIVPESNKNKNAEDLRDFAWGFINGLIRVLADEFRYEPYFHNNYKKISG